MVSWMGRQGRRGNLDASLINAYLAHRQHLLPGSRLGDVVQVTRDIVALHATVATGPYLSLWARVPGFRRDDLDNALYNHRSLVKVLCMRVTLHAVLSDELTYFFQAYAARRAPAELRDQQSLLVQAGLCREAEAGRVLEGLQQRVLDTLADSGPATVRQLSQAVPELQARVRHDVGKPYEGEFSVGSRLVPAMCATGLLIRARPRGTWRSNLYEYAALARWLPRVDLDSVTPQEARSRLVRRYLSAFGPASPDDVQWWTGFSRGETEAALQPLEPELVEVTIEGLGGGYLLLAEDEQRLRGFAPPDRPFVFFLPGLDPYIMGYQDRRRFLAPEHQAKVFDRAGNAMPTVWVNGRVAGAWGQRRAGSVAYRLFEPVDAREQEMLAAGAQCLEAFLEGEFLPQRSHTPFTRALE